jgi:uncharacterized membrane protein YkgB
MTTLEAICKRIVSGQGFSMNLIRIATAIVLIWIGGLKFFDYEAEGIVPFVANSPVMFFFYAHHDDYKGRILKEGEADPQNREWHVSNNTYAFSYGLGVVLILMGIIVLLNYVHPLWGLAGSTLVIIMSVVTLSFLITTPETWVPALGGPDYGFPFLSGRGRLVVKDIIMMAGAFATLTDSAKAYLTVRSQFKA